MEIFSVVVQTLTALAIIFAAWQLLFHSRQMHRELENLYVQRYWELMSERSDSFVVSQVPTAADARVIHSYLQLCEDELELRRLGRVTDSTWAFWDEAIRAQASAAGYRDRLDGYPDPWPRLRELLSSAPGHDPLHERWVWRKFHGL